MERVHFRVLWVDVEDSYIDEMMGYLRSESRYNFDVFRASSLQEAVTIIREEQPNAVLLDIKLGSPKSIETLRYLRKIGEGTRFIVLCSDFDKTLYDQLLDEGAPEVVNKREPISCILARNLLYVIARHHASEQDQQLQRLISASPDAVIVVDGAGIVRFVNAAALKLFGRAEDDFVGELLGFSVKEKETSEIQVLRGKERCYAEMRVVEVEWHKKVAYLATIRDVTEQRRMADHLRQSQKMEAIGQLAGGVAHDFNNILSVISGNLRLARLDLPARHAAQESLSEIENATNRAVELVRQILTFSRSQTTDRQVVEFPPVIHEVTKFLRATIPAQIEISTYLNEGLPTVSADVVQVHQILMNLGANAAYAMREHGGHLEFHLNQVTIDEEMGVPLGIHPGQYLQLMVKDTGPGMDEAVRQRVFEPFFTTKPVGEGTGLGLSMVHGIMKSHSGAITVYSHPGEGTVFKLYFPAIDSSPLKVACVDASAIRGNGQRVLYVDDEGALAFLASRLLQRCGYVCTAFDKPEEALQAFSDNPDNYDIIVTDISMPKLDGPELVRRIQAIRPQIPVIMLTGYIRPQDVEIARSLGVSEIFLKPTNITALSKLIFDAVGNSMDSKIA